MPILDCSAFSMEESQVPSPFSQQSLGYYGLKRHILFIVIHPKKTV